MVHFTAKCWMVTHIKFKNNISYNFAFLGEIDILGATADFVAKFGSAGLIWGLFWPLGPNIWVLGKNTKYKKCLSFNLETCSTQIFCCKIDIFHGNSGKVLKRGVFRGEIITSIPPKSQNNPKKLFACFFYHAWPFPEVRKKL